MNPHDDDDLIVRLEAGIAERRSQIAAPTDIARVARRVARRRATRRTLAGGVPVCAAAAVTVARGSGSSSGPAASHATGAPGGSTSSSARAGSGPVHAVDTAYIVGRVRAKLADVSADGTVVHTTEYASGTVAPDGSLRNLGATVMDAYTYDDPGGVDDSHITDYNGDGSVWIDEAYDWTPGVDGTGDLSKILISPARRAYSENAYHHIGAPNGGGGPSVFSSPAQVQQALRDGQVTQNATGTVDGRPAIALTVVLPRAAAGEHLTLWVDAQTYQPLRDASTADGFSDLFVDEWMATTAANTALAEDHAIPAGYAKVSENQIAPNRT